MLVVFGEIADGAEYCESKEDTLDCGVSDCVRCSWVCEVLKGLSKLPDGSFDSTAGLNFCGCVVDSPADCSFAPEPEDEPKVGLSPPPLA